MCGISGIVSYKNVSKRLVKSLSNLEYRGYDSCGVAYLRNGQIEIRKDIGTISEVEARERLSDPVSCIGIAHTRWATHGGVTKANAHPHLSYHQNFVIIHNGIISNFRELREELSKQGYEFKSDTDSEIVAQLLEYHYEQTKDVEQALVDTIHRLEGSYAFATITPYDPERIYCTRHESPLLIGVGPDSQYIGSDLNAFIEYTKNLITLSDGEYAILDKDGYVIKNAMTGREAQREITHISWDAEISKKGGYPHFMLKEIHEEPQVVHTVMQLESEKIAKLAEMINEAKRVYLTGMGTAYYVTVIAQYYLAQLTGKFYNTLCADEFENVGEFDEDTLVIAVSQSGETYDTLSALRCAKNRGAKTAAVVNMLGSTMSHDVDHVIMQGSGSEICVLSTKAALAQVVALIRTGIELGSHFSPDQAEEFDQRRREILQTPQYIQQILDELSGIIRLIANKIYHITNWLFLGRGIYYAVSLEGALKLKEVTYHHAESMTGGFMKHGTISLIDSQMGSVFFVPPETEKKLHTDTMSNVEEIKARGGFVLGVHSGPFNPLFDQQIILPDAPPFIMPLLHIAASHLLAYFVAVKLRRNIDKPRSLAKSVTVP
ncbi:MAG: glutamine--fructose-6-phosphate transaminase (isomerizing) [Candidatus Cloacimonetes bacterium 4572_55]|nr:MAG: glutamine--fructose-6-phosphate transaminase (isomerizing) [Candidatus Cloacimonetes bacterium 4572_55]